MTPTAGSYEPVTVLPNTPVTGAQPRSQRRSRQQAPATPSTRQSARLALARGGAGMPVPTVEEQVIQLTAARRNISGMPRSLSTRASSGSRFSVLNEVPVDQLAQVAGDCGVVFRGERGPRLDQIAAIKAKEIYEGALAASRAQAELAREGPPETGPLVQVVPEDTVTAVSTSSGRVVPCASSQLGRPRGRPPKAPSRPSTDSGAQSVTRLGTNPSHVSR